MSDFDVIVIGAGAAGLMAAIFAARQQVDGHFPRVLLLDGQTKIGAKILVAGGGRCNVTNEFVSAARFHTESDAATHHNQAFVGRVLRAFSVEATHRFFREAGVELKLESTGKYFPVTDSARTVLNALLREVETAGATLQTGCRVNALEQTAEGWRVGTTQGPFSAPSVIVCTGGLALPKSGSDGAGYEFARRFGHSIVFTTPALSPLIAHPPRHADLSGITLNARLTLRDGETQLARYDGSFLFTHVGYSGPLALNISRHFARTRKAHPRAAIHLCLLPEVENIARWWHEWAGREAKKSLLNALRGLQGNEEGKALPERVAQMILRESKVAPDKPLGKLSLEETRRVQTALFDLSLPVTDVAPYHKAEATAGGVSLAEIEPATMMSRQAPGLFFAGELCDVDGWLGGYNFQWAWSSGAVAGRASARYALKR